MGDPDSGGEAAPQDVASAALFTQAAKASSRSLQASTPFSATLEQQETHGGEEEEQRRRVTFQYHLLSQTLNREERGDVQQETRLSVDTTDACLCVNTFNGQKVRSCRDRKRMRQKGDEK